LTKHVVPEALQRMLHQFWSKAPTCCSDEVYDELFDLECWEESIRPNKAQ
jgi:hypothetical protein